MIESSLIGFAVVLCCHVATGARWQPEQCASLKQKLELLRETRCVGLSCGRPQNLHAGRLAWCHAKPDNRQADEDCNFFRQSNSRQKVVPFKPT